MILIWPKKLNVAEINMDDNLNGHDRETIGKISYDLSQKTPDSRDPIELQKEMQRDYQQNLIDCVNYHKNIIHGSFYIVVITKKERLMQNVLRNYFFATEACPTPTWDQAVYYYNRPQENITFIWVLPSKDTCELLAANKLEVDRTEWDLLQFVLDFHDGSLLRKAKKLNGEQFDSPLLEK